MTVSGIDVLFVENRPTKFAPRVCQERAVGCVYSFC